MNLLFTPLLAAVIAADQHAGVWAQALSKAQAPGAVELAAADAPVAPTPMAQAGYAGDRRPPPPPMQRLIDGPPRIGPAHMGPPHMGPPPGLGDHPPGPPFLRGLDLTEAQQDKVFEILHAQAPLLRQRLRDLHKAGDELLVLSRAERFDEARATALADASGRAAAAVALVHARSEAAVWQLLTPEQRKQAIESPPHPFDGPRMPSPGAMSPPR